MAVRVTFRWLGISGIELTCQDKVLLVDPCVTRVPFWRLWFGRMQSDSSLVERILPRADHIFITHAHYDHLLDAPGLAVSYGAALYGSANTCQIARFCGVPDSQIHYIRPGDSLDLGVFSVKALAGSHLRLPFFTAGGLPSHLKPPLTARQYRMDECFSFLIACGGVRLLVNANSAPEVLNEADVLLLQPFPSEEYYWSMLARVKPRLVIPIHWDELWKPLTQPARPSWQPPRWSIPPLRRVNLGELENRLKRIDPKLRFFTPERLRGYNLGHFVE